ncbi:4-(cytidine 5'-diphospho)-2-C-methyl-D-erythritol kinase [Thalassotalea euphylliae]|uniref:4-diphosphocytidyl-2-C-methyl-D-erythritol kinase n=1 Tax=Thalassotalea euphylliae TaxID=1655234 RepID=A0A3E0TPE3_9GAMM|nr:4-(cytidine 5'-diphospho)-2-C-methyl-D-erythritol kinase [Thalassotalea euphylliae]REL26394.1 4-(cytidine 5'-diphospho)-2-C-methyl-D-erythritol kinase [Thalassotalea euphylliae]
MTNTTYTLPSPAKLNLFLHVNGRRSDGYHELQTLFQFLDYSDTISLTLTDNNNVTLTTPIEGVAQADNLIVKAAKLLEPLKSNQLGVEIAINKVLPMGGGLGGGSSNAATVLLALNELWQLNLPLEKLAELGLSLGADVPIFVRGFAAFAEGVGEQLVPANPTEHWYVVSKPDVHIATQEVFQSDDLPRNTEKISAKALNTDHRQNDCEVVVTKHYPEVAKLLATLLEYAPSRMTGTGACIFTTCASEQEARDIQAKLPTGITSFVAKGVNQSPTHVALETLRKKAG